MEATTGDYAGIVLGLVAAVLVGIGLRLAAREKPGRERWINVATLLIVGGLMGLLALYAVLWLVADPDANFD